MKQLLNIIKKTGVGLVVSFLVAFSPAAAHVSAETSPNDTTAPSTTSQRRGPQSPTGAAASTYTYNETTGKWENEHYIWDPATGLTTAKETAEYSYNPETQTWDTSNWEFDAAAQKYQAVPEKTTTPPPAATQSNSTSNSLNNTITSDAITGNASVTGNTSGGNATSGDATAIANVINLLQSSYSTLGNESGVVTFMANIPGDVTGNLLVDPAAIAQNQGTTDLQSSQAIKVNNEEDGAINNEILLNASSGDAGVVANTTGGNATSGNANAVANVVNMMNSSVGAHQSFIGMINVQGDLSGDILFPTGFFDSLIASNTAANSSVDSSLTNNVNQAINNNVSATAQSGEANVLNNTTAGNGTSGLAQTTLTVMNLTGSDIIGDNALMVFVNVGGRWTGLIMNAPGSTVATLGSGISQDTSTAQTFEANLNNDVDQAINNDISVKAQTGDATVSQNTSAGNATSGNANATVNLANIINSRLSLSNWFGILFINVLGNWNGSFGTSQPQVADSDTIPTPGGDSPSPVFSFTSTSPETTPANRILAVASGIDQTEQSAPASNTQTEENNQPELAVLGDTTALNDGSSGQSPSSSNLSYNLLLPVIGAVLGALILGSEKITNAFRKGKVLLLPR